MFISLLQANLGKNAITFQAKQKEADKIHKNQTPVYFTLDILGVGKKNQGDLLPVDYNKFMHWNRNKTALYLNRTDHGELTISNAISVCPEFEVHAYEYAPTGRDDVKTSKQIVDVLEEAIKFKKANPTRPVLMNLSMDAESDDIGTIREKIFKSNRNFANINEEKEYLREDLIKKFSHMGDENPYKKLYAALDKFHKAGCQLFAAAGNSSNTVNHLCYDPMVKVVQGTTSKSHEVLPFYSNHELNNSLGQAIINVYQDKNGRHYFISGNKRVVLPKGFICEQEGNDNFKIPMKRDPIYNLETLKNDLSFPGKFKEDEKAMNRIGLYAGKKLVNENDLKGKLPKPNEIILKNLNSSWNVSTPALIKVEDLIASVQSKGLNLSEEDIKKLKIKGDYVPIGCGFDSLDYNLCETSAFFKADNKGIIVYNPPQQTTRMLHYAGRKLVNEDDLKGKLPKADEIILKNLNSSWSVSEPALVKVEDLITSIQSKGLNLSEEDIKNLKMKGDYAPIGCGFDSLDFHLCEKAVFFRKDSKNKIFYSPDGSLPKNLDRVVGTINGTSFAAPNRVGLEGKKLMKDLLRVSDNIATQCKGYSIQAKMILK